MALDQQYRKMLRDLMLQSDSLAGQQTLPDGSIIGYGANNPEAMVAAVAPPPPMPDVQQVNQQPQTPQQLSALLVNQRPQGFNDQQRFDEAYQFKQAMPEKQSYLRNNTTGAVQELPSFVRPTQSAPTDPLRSLIDFGRMNQIDPDILTQLVQYQSSAQAGMPSAKDIYIDARRFNRPIDKELAIYNAAAQAQRGQLQAEKERLGIDKARAEIDQLRAKPTAEQGTWSTVESNGKTYLVNNKTGQIKPAEVGGTQLLGKKASDTKKEEAIKAAIAGNEYALEGIGQIETRLAKILGVSEPDLPVILGKDLTKASEAIAPAAGPIQGRVPYVTTLSPFKASDIRSNIENLQQLAQTYGLEGMKARGVSPGSITVAEWPKFAARLANIDLNLSDNALASELQKIYAESKEKKLKLQSDIERIKANPPANQSGVSVQATPNTVTLPDGKVLTFPSGAAAEAFKREAGIR